MAVLRVGGKGVVGCVVAVLGNLYDIVRPLAERHPKLSPPGYFPDLE